MNRNNNEIIGLLPAAGHATRIAPLPCSKEIFPIGFYDEAEDQKTGIRVVSSAVIDSMKKAGANQIYMVIRKGKWDIPDYFGTGKGFHVSIAYIVTDETPGTPFTIRKAIPFIKDKTVLFGFPDIFINNHQVFDRLLDKQKKTGSDLILGLFEADNPKKMDMVETDDEGNVKNIVIKPKSTHLTYSWIVAVWTPLFTKFLDASISGKIKKNSTAGSFKKSGNMEIYIGDIIQIAIQNKLTVQSVLFPDEFYCDIGTIEGMSKMYQYAFNKQSK